MQEEDDESYKEDPLPVFPSKTKTDMTPTKSLVRFQTHRLCSDRLESSPMFQERYSSSRVPKNKDRPVEAPKHAASDCWRANSGEVHVELVELYKDEEDDYWGARTRRRKLEDVGRNASVGAFDVLSHTKEFHVLNEVQKARILTVIEETIRKMANSDYKVSNPQEEHSRCPENGSLHEGDVNVQKFICRKFLIPWVLMKVLEMLICHIIQLAFLSNDSYFQRKSEFLPVVVTYYLTLFIITSSLLVNVICFSYAGIQHPCYLMCVVSSSILALTTAFGVLIILCCMDYYKAFREILVLVFIAALLICLVVELCICYIEVKSFWKRMENTEYFFS